MTGFMVQGHIWFETTNGSYCHKYVTIYAGLELPFWYIDIALFLFFFQN